MVTTIADAMNAASSANQSSNPSVCNTQKRQTTLVTMTTKATNMSTLLIASSAMPISGSPCSIVSTPHGWAEIDSRGWLADLSDPSHRAQLAWNGAVSNPARILSRKSIAVYARMSDSHSRLYCSHALSCSSSSSNAGEFRNAGREIGRMYDLMQDTKRQKIIYKAIEIAPALFSGCGGCSRRRSAS